MGDQVLLEIDAPDGTEPSAARETVEEAPPVAHGRIAPIFAFWLSIPVLGAALLFLFAELEDAMRFAVVGLVFSSAWTLVTVLTFRLTSRFSFEHPSRLGRNVILMAAGLLAAVAVAVVLLAASRLVGLGPREVADRSPGWVVVLRMLPMNLMIYGAVAVTGLARDAGARARSRREEAVRLQAHNSQLQAQLAEARLRVLRTQLNPHFLFNTLNAVSGLVDENPRAARRTIAHLSDILRFALQETAAAEIPLHDELKLVSRYLELLEIRYEDLLETRIDAPPDLRDALVPSLILQPLVENAMMHAIARVGGRGRIVVEAERSADRLILRVLDSGLTGGKAVPGSLESGVRGVANSGGGLGLRHTRERLRELYGDDQSFALEPLPDGGMAAVIDLPYHIAPLAGSAGRGKRT